MPKYFYYCHDCSESFYVYHSMSHIQNECVRCFNNDIKKLVTMPAYMKENMISKKTKTGDLTKQHIKDNREILEEEKRKAREEMYEPS